MAENFAQRIIGHYERHAIQWDADRQDSFWNDRVWHDRFIGQLAPGGKILDLGCGSGRPVAQHLSERGFQVTGVDSSPTMISLCRSRFPDHEWIVADMRTASLGRQFDGILAWDSFFHLNYEDQRNMFGLFAEHAGANSLLMFNAGPMHGEGIGRYRGDPLFLASLATDECEALLHCFGFEVLEHVINDSRAGGRTAWLSRFRGGR
jgi:SAM-dependent methyltransferase